MLLTCPVDDDVSIDHLTEVVFPKFIYCKSTFLGFFPLYMVFLGRKLLTVTHAKGVGIKLRLIEEGVSTQIIWDSCIWDLSLLSHSFIQLFVSVWTHWYLFYTSGYNPV